MVLVKKSKIFSSFVLSKVGLEIMLSYGLEKKQAFHDDRHVNFVKSKNGYFPKGLTHGFCQKIQNFFYFAFEWNGPRNNAKPLSKDKLSLSEE